MSQKTNKQKGFIDTAFNLLQSSEVPTGVQNCYLWFVKHIEKIYFFIQIRFVLVCFGAF